MPPRETLAIVMMVEEGTVLIKPMADTLRVSKTHKIVTNLLIKKKRLMMFFSICGSSSTTYAMIPKKQDGMKRINTD